jgi:tetratricopeptide (TPR) repeat protein
LASKIGTALIRTHDFDKAVNYYEAALKNGGAQPILRADLAALYIKLKKFDKAFKVSLA